MLDRELAGLIDKINQNRKSRGFLGIDDLFDFCGNTNLILDPFSILISPEVQIGIGNVLYPNVIIEVQNNGRISVGNNNIFHPATLLLANQGIISMGNNNELGDGGLRIKA